MENQVCPNVIHFHVVYESVSDFERPSKVVLTKTPLEALASFLPELPSGWKGSISIFDDENGHEDEMPLLHHIIK